MFLKVLAVLMQVGESVDTGGPVRSLVVYKLLEQVFLLL